MASNLVALQNPRGVDPKDSPSSTSTPITTWELVASGDGVGATRNLQPAVHDARSIFFINFCNIHGLHYNFHFLEHHLSSSRHRLLFLTETLLFERSDSKPYSV